MSSWEPVQPAYFTLAMLDPERRRPAEWWQGSPRVWGVLELRLTVAPDSRLHIGSGAPRPTGSALAAAHASAPRRRGKGLVDEPVVPGSSLKGATRVVVEALSPSCDPLGPDPCKPSAVCPACLVFGAAGRRGLVGFTEATVLAEAVPLQYYRIAQRYSHARAPRRGRRLYGPDPESPLPRATEVLEVLAGGTQLAASLALDGVPDWGAGLVTVALGLGGEGLCCLRLGAGKNRGMGIVNCELDRGWWADHFAAAAAGNRQPVDADVIDRWQRATLARFPVAKGRRDAIQQRYGCATP